MEQVDSKQSQGQVSAQGESPKDVNQSSYTQEEKDFAAKYKVEPKLIRMIAEIVSEHTSEITQLIDLVNGKTRQEAEPQQVETQQQPEQEKTGELCIDQQTQERIKSYYKNLDPKTKLAIATLSEIQFLEGINFQAREKEEKLFAKIWTDIEAVCLETFHRESDDVADIALGTFDSEDVWLCGVWEACRMVIQNC